MRHGGASHRIRSSTDQQDLTAQRGGLLTLGVDPARVYVDHGQTGTNRERPGLREALAACREGRHADGAHAVIESAYKHGVEYQEIIHAFDHAIRRFEMDDDFTMIVRGGLYEIGCLRVNTLK